MIHGFPCTETVTLFLYSQIIYHFKGTVRQKWKRVQAYEILETGINDFKSISDHKNRKSYEISAIYDCVENLSMIIGCNLSEWIVWN